MILPEEFLICTSLIIESIELGDGNNFHQVFVACFVLDEEYELMASPIFGSIILTVQILTDEYFCPENWFDANLLGLHIKLDSTIERGCVSECQ